MTNLTFDESIKKSYTYEELANLNKEGRVPVIVAKSGLIYIGKPKQNGFREFFTDLAYAHNEGDKIYFFLNSMEISHHLQGGGCLDKFLYNPPKNDKMEILKKWLNDYTYVGARWSGGNRYHLKYKNSTIKVYSSGGNEQCAISSDYVDDYENFIGTDNQYEFFRWLLNVDRLV